METSLKDFERSMQEHLARYQQPKREPVNRPSPAVGVRRGLKVVLTVRKGTSGLCEEFSFTHVSDSTCRDVALAEARGAATRAGYPFLARIFSVDSL